MNFFFFSELRFVASNMSLIGGSLSVAWKNSYGRPFASETASNHLFNSIDNGDDREDHTCSRNKFGT
jgi:hypothetical protein